MELQVGSIVHPIDTTEGWVGLGGGGAERLVEGKRGGEKNIYQRRKKWEEGWEWKQKK